MSDLQARLQAALGDAYQVERELGGGGMSRVFVATEASLHRAVVIKLLPPEFASEVSEARFKQEIELAAHLQHPNILPVLTAGAKGDLLFYVMPFVSGESLRHRLTREGKLPVADAVRIMHEMADALAYAHAEGVIHRDVKPENILLEGGHAVLTDFGVARAVAESRSGGRLTDTGLALGTPGYMSPEQAAGERHVDARADVYALAVVGYEMLAGFPPFAGPTAQALIAAHLTATPKPLPDTRPEAPPAVANAIARALAKDPNARLRTAAEFRDSVEGAVARSDVGVPRRRAWLVAAAAAIIAVRLGGALMSRSRGAAAKVDPNVVAVFPFRVTGADASLQYLREGMVDLLGAKLTGEDGVRAADTRTVLSAWHRAGGTDREDLTADGARSVARRVGAGKLVLGEVVGTPNRLILSAAIVASSSGRSSPQASVDGPPDSLLTLVERLVRQLLTTEVASGGRELVALTTSSLPALQAYLRGRAQYRRGLYEEAARDFERAVQIDSAFALAGLDLLRAAEWATGSSARQMDLAARVAWAHRDRLGPPDLANLVEYIGARYPELPTGAEQIADAQRVVSLAPDRPEAWYELGDGYFHIGAALGIESAAQQAEAAFRRSLALDSAFAPPLEHLLDLALKSTDTAEIRRLNALYDVLHPGADVADAYRWRAAIARADSVGLAGLRARAGAMTTQALWRVIGYGEANGYGLPDAEQAAAVLRGRAGPQGERDRTTRMLHDLALNRGRPTEAALLAGEGAQIPGERRDMLRIRVLDALYWAGDSVAGAQAAREVEAKADAPLAATAVDRAEQYADVCVAEQWRLAKQDLRGADQALARLRGATSPRDSPGVVAASRTCLVALEGMVAVARHASNARVLIERLDSTLVTAFLYEGAQRIFAHSVESELALLTQRLWEGEGEPVRALRAARRRYYGWGPESTRYLSSLLKDEGRLAALTGDREGAIRAYQHYLALSADPEPSMKPEVDRVRLELARLVAEPRTR